MDLIKVLCEDFLIRNNELWFFSRFFNGLMKMDINTGTVDIVSKIPSYRYETERLVAKLVVCDNRIFCIPMNAEEIWIYYINKNEWEPVLLKKISEEKINGKFFQACVNKNIIYLIPCAYWYIAAINIDTYEIKYFEFVDELAKKHHDAQNDCYFRSDCVEKDNILYLASCIDNRILKFNFYNQKVSWISVGKKSYPFSGIVYDGDKFWISPRGDGNIIIWDGLDEFEEVIMPRLENAYYLGIVDYNGYIVVSGQSNCGNIVLNKSTKAINVQQNYYLANKVLEDGKMNVSIQIDGTLNIEMKDGVKKTWKCQIDRDKLIPFIEFSGIKNESEIMTLGMFLEII